MADKVCLGISPFLTRTLIFLKSRKTMVFVRYLLFLTNITVGAVNGFAWGTVVLEKLQDKSTKLKGAVWIIEVFI